MEKIFISPEEKEYFQSALNDVHEIFKRPLIVFRQASRVFVSENLNYNPFYGTDQQQTDISGYVINSGIICGRIYHLPGLGGNKVNQSTSTSDREFSARGEPQIRFNNDKDMVRLKLDASGFCFFSGCYTVDIDGMNYNLKSAARQHGLFTPEYYTVWLEQNS